MKRSKKILKWVVGILAVAFVVLQFVPVERTNPPVEADLDAPAEVKAVLKRACYDCHSNETVWPWYANVAPVSILLARDVNEGRRNINFSHWGKLTERKRAGAARAMWREVSEGKMPLPVYLPMHPEARLTEADKAVIRSWAESLNGGTLEEE